MCTRLTVNISQIYMPMYITETLHMHKVCGNIAYIFFQKEKWWVNFSLYKHLRERENFSLYKRLRERERERERERATASEICYRTFFDILLGRSSYVRHQSMRCSGYY